MEIIAFNLELKDSGFVQCKANADTISSGKNFTVVPMTRVGKGGMQEPACIHVYSY
jgi:hypothetical protein